MGAVILGLVAFGYSYHTNKFKRQQNYTKTNIMVITIFIDNSLITSGGRTYWDISVIK
jgi:hypothetical protein